MRNIKLEISFDGSKFSGFQRQPDRRTIQGELERAIFESTEQVVNITPCGRTDTGVHAVKHISNFYIDSDLPARAFKYKIQEKLDGDIVIIESSEVEEAFHSRFDAKSKTYRYIVENRENPLPFNRNYKTFVKAKLDMDKMMEASKKLIGHHDFKAFMKWNDYKGEEVNTLRSIDRIDIKKKKGDIIFDFKAESFLHNQIRITVGLFIDIGRGYRDLSYIDDIFEGKVERAAKTYGPQGLYLMDVEY